MLRDDERAGWVRHFKFQSATTHPWAVKEKAFFSCYFLPGTVSVLRTVVALDTPVEDSLKVAGGYVTMGWFCTLSSSHVKTAALLSAYVFRAAEFFPPLPSRSHWHDS